MSQKFKEAQIALTNPKVDFKIHPRMMAARKAFSKVAETFDVSILEREIGHCEAPTGIGKTIGCSLIGARSACQSDIQHLIFATPLILLTEQAEAVLKHQLMETSLKVAKTHSKMAYPSDAARKRGKRLGFDVNICTTQKLHLALLEYKKHMGAHYNLAKSVIIIDDAALYLRPKFAAAVLVLLDKLRQEGARILLASASLPHYDKIPGYLPKEIKIHRFAGEIKEMPGIRTRCLLKTTTRPVGIDRLVSIVQKNARPSLIICETVRKCSHVFNALRQEMPEAKLFMVNAKQAKYKKRENIATIERALKTECAHKIIVVSTSTTHAGWNVSFASGINDTFDTINALEQAGRINRAMEFGQKGVLECMQIQIPGVHRNPSVDTYRIIAMDIMEKNLLSDPMATTIAAQRELESQSTDVAKATKKLTLAAKKGDMSYLRKNLITMGPTNAGRNTLPPDKEIPQILVQLRNMFRKLGFRAQVLKGTKIRLEEQLSYEQIQRMLEKANEIFEEFSMELNETKLRSLQEQGDILTRIVFNLPSGEPIETEYYMLAPRAFDKETGMPR